LAHEERCLFAKRSNIAARKNPTYILRAREWEAVPSHSRPPKHTDGGNDNNFDDDDEVGGRTVWCEEEERWWSRELCDDAAISITYSVKLL